MRLLIGNTTNRETLEHLAEGYRRLEQVADVAEAQTYPKRIESQQMGAETAENITESVELMNQTDEGELLIKTLVEMIEEKWLRGCVYTKGRRQNHQLRPPLESRATHPAIRTHRSYRQ